MAKAGSVARRRITPGDPTYSHPDLFAGAAVPAAIADNSATFRDVDRALQVVVAEVSGTSFHEKIFVGTSTGAVCGRGMAFGRSVVGTTSVRTGGNYWMPYDDTSPRIFDGFVFNGFLYKAPPRTPMRNSRCRHLRSSCRDAATSGTNTRSRWPTSFWRRASRSPAQYGSTRSRT